MANRPTLSPGLNLPMEVFNILNSSRQYGMGPSPLLVHEIVAACQMLEVPRGNWPDYLYFVKELDNVWMQNAVEKRKS